MMLRTRVLWTGVAGTPWYSNFFWAGDSSALATAAASATNAWCNYMKGIVVNEITFEVEDEVVAINPVTGEMFDIFPVEGNIYTGTDTGEPLPFQVQALTTLGTAAIEGGRRIKGRCFLGGLSEGGNTTGIGPSAESATIIETGFETTLGGAGAVHVVWSRKNGTNVPITSYNTSTVWSSLRTRRATG